MGTAALVAIWLFIPWQWSPVDDPGQVLTMRDLVGQHGMLGAVVERFQQLAQGDRDGGVFRPMAWVYPPLIYLVPAVPGHVIRLLMVLVIIVGPLVYFRRRGASSQVLAMTLLLLIISASTAYQGLLLLSIQEIGGLAFISLGLMARGQTLRVLLWVCAALFKGPFLWILFGNAWVLYRRGDRRGAVLNAFLATVLLAINVWWSQTGTYVSRYNIAPWEPYQWINASKLLEPQNGAVLLVVVWWLLLTQTRFHRRADFPIFAFAFFGYFLQMIPWGFTAYYMAPISFFLGLMLASTLTNGAQLSWPAAVMSFAVPTLVAAWVLFSSLGFVMRSNMIMVESSRCLSQTFGAITEIRGGWLYLTSSMEGPLRLSQNTRLFFPEWEGSVQLAQDDAPQRGGEPPTHLLVIPGGEQRGLQGTTICKGRYVSLVEIDEPATS